MMIDELTEAIAIDTTDKCWDSGKMSADGERLIGHCGNLVVFDQETREVRLAHYTVQQFLLSLPVDMSVAGLHIDLPTATVQLGEACITYLSFSDFETQVTRRRSPLPVDKSLLLDSAIDQVPFGKRLVKDAITSWNHVRRASAKNFDPVIDLTNHLVAGDKATSSERMHAKYRFLRYAIENWTGHTKSLTKDNQRLWGAFADLALNKQMLFEFSPWDNVQVPHDFPHSKMFSWAIDAGHLALLRLTPYSGSDLREILISQAQKGSTEVLEVLCQVSGLSLGDLPIDEIVCDAAAEGRHDFLEVLLRLDADPNAKSYSGEIALGCAFVGEHESTLRLLLEYGADPDLRLHENPFDFSGPISSSEEGKFPLLYLAVNSGRTALTAALLSAGANVNVIASVDSQACETPLQAAVERCHYEMVEMLLKAKADVNYFSPLSPTVLQVAARNGESQLVILLLYAKADPNLNAGMVPALCTAAKNGHIEMVERLLAAKADANLRSPNGMTALQAAAGNNYVYLVKLLLKAKADINATSEIEKHTSLQLAAERGLFYMVELLLAAEADVNICAPGCKTALQLAAEGGYLYVIKQLLAAGAEVNFCTNNFITANFTALQVAVRSGHLRAVKGLLVAGADVNISAGITALELAVAHKNFNMVRLLLASKADVNVASQLRGGTALIEAAKIGYLEIVQMLLHAGANVNAQSYSKQTALMEAAIHNNLPITNQLLNAGASTELRDQSERTALDLATLHNAEPALIEILKMAEDKSGKFTKR